MQIKSVPLQASLTFYHHFYVALWYGSLVSYAVEYAKHQMQNDARFGRYWCSFVLLGLDAFVSLQDIKHDMLHQTMENTEQEVAQRNKMDWLNPAPCAPPDREDLLLKMQKSVEELLVNQGSMSAILRLLHLLMSEAARRITETNTDHCTVKLTANIISIPGVDSMLKLLGFHFQSLAPHPTNGQNGNSWPASGKAASAHVVMDSTPTLSHAHPVAVLFPHWNPDKLLRIAQQVVAALIDLSACSQCVNALIWILPLTRDILEQLIALLEKSQSSPMTCPRLTEKGVATLWNQPHLRDFLQVIGYEQAGLFLLHNPRTENKSLLLGSFNLFLALRPLLPHSQYKLDPQDVSVQQSKQDSQETYALREDQLTQGPQETSALREDQSTQGPQETSALREDQSTQGPRETSAHREDLNLQGPQETLALTYKQTKQGPQENLLSTDDQSSLRSQESLAPREEQSSQGPQEPLISILIDKKGGPGSQETLVERTRKMRQGPQKGTGDTTRGKKTKQGPRETAARRNKKNIRSPSGTPLASDKPSEQDAQESTADVEGTVSGNSKVCLNTLKPLLVLRHQIMMQAPWLTVKATSEEVQVKRGLVHRLASIHSQQQAHIRSMELWHKKTLKDLEHKPEKSESKTQACGIKKVKVKGPRTPSSNRTPLDAPTPVSHSVAHNLSLRSTAHEIIKEQEGNVRHRHRAEVNDLFLSFIDPMPDAM